MLTCSVPPFHGEIAFIGPVPGALPQAITLRRVAAESQESRQGPDWFAFHRRCCFSQWLHPWQKKRRERTSKDSITSVYSSTSLPSIGLLVTWLSNSSFDVAYRIVDTSRPPTLYRLSGRIARRIRIINRPGVWVLQCDLRKIAEIGDRSFRG